MTLNEAKVQIASEFIERYQIWLNNRNTMPKDEYAKKYGCLKNDEEVKDIQKSMLWFQKHIFNGKFSNNWKKSGISGNVLFELSDIGFLSFKTDSSWLAQQFKETDFFFINQATAKKIYKAYKDGFFSSEKLKGESNG